MKKVIAILTLLLAFTINVNAQQDNKVTAPKTSVAAREDAASLTKFLELTPIQENDFARLFTKKYKILENPESKPEQRDQAVRMTDAKIRATLTDAQMSKLEENKELYAKMTGAALNATMAKK